MCTGSVWDAVNFLHSRPHGAKNSVTNQFLVIAQQCLDSVTFFPHFAPCSVLEVGNRLGKDAARTDDPNSPKGLSIA